MKLFLLITTFLLMFTSQVSGGCCGFKIVESGTGDSRDGNYTLNSTRYNLPVTCQDECVYTKNGGDPEEFYCFGAGDLDSQCFAPQADPTIPQGLPEVENGNDDAAPPGGYYYNSLPGSDTTSLVCGAIFTMVTEDRMDTLDLATMGGGLVSSDHDEWSSNKLRFDRIDGASSGDVQYDHLVGIFATSDIGSIFRLDVKNAAASDSATKRLKVTASDGTDCSGAVQYGTEYSIFTESGFNRLDIGQTGTGGATTWDNANGGTILHVNMAD